MQLTDSDRRLMRIRGRARAGSEAPIPPAVQAYLNGGPLQPKTPASADGEQGRESERRRSARVPVASEVLVRRVGGFSFEVALHDVSNGGCRVELLEPCEVGDPVIARFPQLEPLGSRVCWAAGTTAGMQFLTTIHPAVFDSLLTRLADEPTAA